MRFAIKILHLCAVMFLFAACGGGGGGGGGPNLATPSCGENERQIAGGGCACISGYERDANRACVRSSSNPNPGTPNPRPPPSASSDIVQPVVVVPRGAPLTLTANVVENGVVSARTITVAASAAGNLIGRTTVTLTDENAAFARGITIAQTITAALAGGGAATLAPQTIAAAAAPITLTTTAGQARTVSAASQVPSEHPSAFVSSATVTTTVTLARGEAPAAGATNITLIEEAETVTLSVGEVFYIPDSAAGRETTITMTLTETKTLPELRQTVMQTVVSTVTLFNTITVDGGAFTLMLDEDAPDFAARAPAEFDFAAAGAGVPLVLEFRGITLGVVTVTAGFGTPHILTATIAQYVVETEVNRTAARIYAAYEVEATVATTMTSYLSTVVITEEIPRMTTAMENSTVTTYTDGTVAMYRGSVFAYAVLPPPNEEIMPRSVFRTPEFLANYGTRRIRADAAYSRGYFGQGVTVGIVDSGVLTSHADLRDNVVAGYDFASDTTVITDPTGHGTFVAGVVAAAMDGKGMHGVAPQAKLMPLQIVDQNRNFTRNENRAFRFGLERNVRIFNNSYGIGGRAVHGTYNGKAEWVEIPIFAPLIGPNFSAANTFNAQFGNEDAVWVWAAGNQGWQTGGFALVCSILNSPSIRDCEMRGGISRRPIADLLENFVANCTDPPHINGICGSLSTIRVTVNGEVLGIPESGTEYYNLFPLYYPQLADRWLSAVGTSSGSNRRLWSGSNGCGDAKFWCLAAPGQLIYSTDTSQPYRLRNGTSFAAPHISGALAVLKSRLPSMPMSVVRALLLYTAEDLTPNDGMRVDADFGWGLVNLEAATTLQGSVRLAPPVAPPTAVLENTLALSLPPPNALTASLSVFHTAEFTRNYGLGRIKADAAYARGYFGQGVTVGVADSGMLTSHVDLSGNIVAGRNFAATSDIEVIDEPLSSFNPIGHGTAVGGVIAAVRNNRAGSVHGVAPQTKLMPLQLADIYGRLFPFLAGNPIAAFRWAADRYVPIINNSYGRLQQLVGTYNGKRYYATIPFFQELRTTPAELVNFRVAGTEIANAVAGEDMALVWEAGDDGWREGGKIRLCADITLAIAGLQDCPDGMRLTVTPQELINGFVSESYALTSTLAISVNSFGNPLTLSYTLNMSLRARGTLAALGLPGSGTGFYGMLPREYPEIMHQWLVVVATDENDEIAEFSTACGDAKFWCLAAPGDAVTTTFATGDNAVGETPAGVSFAAPHVSGALAVLKSRLTTMPMSAVRAVLLHTARDLTPDDGMRVDENTGWGLVDLEKAITLQGNVEIVLDDSDSPSGEGGARLAETRILLPAGFEGVRARLNQISAAVSVFGDAHYNTSLGALAAVSEAAETNDLGDAAADMLAAENRLQAGFLFAETDEGRFRGVGAEAEFAGWGAWRLRHNFCEECGRSAWAEWDDFGNAPAAPFFAEDKSAFVLEMRGKGLRPFAAFSGEVHSEGALPYRQLGLRWTGGGALWDLSAEGSEISERESFAGVSFGALGKTRAKTRQGRLQLRGALGGGWRGFASYELAQRSKNGRRIFARRLKLAGAGMVCRLAAGELVCGRRQTAFDGGAEDRFAAGDGAAAFCAGGMFGRDGGRLF